MHRFQCPRKCRWSRYPEKAISQDPLPRRAIFLFDPHPESGTTDPAPRVRLPGVLALRTNFECSDDFHISFPRSSRPAALQSCIHPVPVWANLRVKFAPRELSLAVRAAGLSIARICRCRLTFIRILCRESLALLPLREAPDRLPGQRKNGIGIRIRM